MWKDLPMATQMPPEGTTAKCAFCRKTVALRPGESGARYWLLPGEEADGAARCLGGLIPRRGVPRTLHVPWRHQPDFANENGELWPAWYDAEGRPQNPRRTA
jgi:hypothetical protein